MVDLDRRARRLWGLALVTLAVAVLAPVVGSHAVSLAEVFGGDPTASTIFWQLRVPRVLLALLAGGLLAAAGAAFQALFRNPLAEPYTLGIASGAALGAAAVFTLAPGGWAAGLPLAGVAAFAGAVAATLVVLTLGSRRSVGSHGLLLAGVAVALTCQAIILFLQYLADATETLRMVRWMMGGLGVVGYSDVLWVLPWVLLVLGALFFWRRELDLVLAGDEIARGRGVDLDRFRRRLLLVVSLGVGALVSVAGPIGFVGLIVPHLLRGWIGASHRGLLPACFLAGGAFLVLCDLAARVVLTPAELPVGIVTALLGGPFFLWVLGRKS
jgi:iron complex transport system permease protein